MAIGCDPGVGIAIVFWKNACSVQMRNCTDFGHALFFAVNRVVQWKKVLGWEFIDPLDRDRLAFADFESWSRPHAVVSPHLRRRKIAMRFMTERAHMDWNHCASLWANDRRNR